MNRSALLCFPALASLALFATTLSQGAASSGDSNLPRQIESYYRDYNYVSLFSSEQEREVIADSLMCNGTLGSATRSELNFCDEIPSVPKTQRLDRIRTLIPQLSKHVIRATNSMDTQEYVPGEGSHLRKVNPQMQPLRRNPYSPTAEVLDIKQIKRNNNAVTVEVAVYPLDPSINARLISRYGTRIGERPSNESLIALAAPSSVLKHEFHQWIQEGGTWKKFETSTAFISL